MSTQTLDTAKTTEIPIRQEQHSKFANLCIKYQHDDKKTRRILANSKILGKKVFCNQGTMGWHGIVHDMDDVDVFIVRNHMGQMFEVNIEDIRNPEQ